MATATCTNVPTQKRRFSPLAWLMHALETRRERLDLANLTAKQLEDIGLTYRDAQYEANRPIWDVPAHWTRSQN